ncbi:MAG: polyamine aminopropyltransferase [Patescibacteria group bacterium]
MKKYIFPKDKFFIEEPAPYDKTQTIVGMEVKKVLYRGRSSFQKIEFFDTYEFGKILALDGITQTTEKDEFIYHEMLCQIPMLMHSALKRVLIIGGGDGGSLEEVLKHNVEKVWMVEIDKMVMDLSKKYLPSISKGAFHDKRAEVIIGDGKEYIRKSKNFFDVIIMDLSDPGGPAEELVSLKFYKDVKRALKKGGIICIQGGSFDIQPSLVRNIFVRLNKIFSYVRIHLAVVPAYQAGECCFIMASADKRFENITQKEIEKKIKKLKLDLKYLSPEIYFSSQVIPRYLKEKLK